MYSDTTCQSSSREECLLFYMMAAKSLLNIYGLIFIAVLCTTRATKNPQGLVLLLLHSNELVEDLCGEHICCIFQVPCVVIYSTQIFFNVDSI